MNKQYIKRQITLHKLGFPMSEDIKEYYEYFHSLIGDINDLEELRHEDYSDSIFWRKDGKVILEYNIRNTMFWVKYDIIWSKFEEKYELGYGNIKELLGAILEETFKLKANTTHKEHKVVSSVRWSNLSI